ncbi:hypothetical protein QN400_06020 [Pseudomonas sp. RTC3]|nr:hypothetical protein [Pseudomonas sp. RTC3]
MAWNAVSEARHHVGYCYGICDSLVRTTAERASKGGQANAKKKSDFKKNVIHALQSLPPQKSCKTPSVIAKKIAQNLINSPHQLKGTQAEIMISLISKIWNMIEEDKEVKSAFNVQPSKDQKSSLSHT